MIELAENTLQTISLKELENHPDLLKNVLVQNDEIALMLRRQGDRVFVYYKKMYTKEVDDILKEAKQVHQRKKKKGYDREQAFEDFLSAQRDIEKFLE